MKSLKSASAAAVIVLSTSVNADILSYGGYTHDTTTDIVTGNGLEWLQWDATIGLSINDALTTYSADGWRVASNVEMAQLFNAFDFGLTFDIDESTDQRVKTGFSHDELGTEADRSFITMFGDTYAASGQSSCFSGDCFEVSHAFFGTDPNANGLVNFAEVREDNISATGTLLDGEVILGGEAVTETLTGSWAGVALVRDVSPVPVPAAVWLFGSGLLGLIGVARRKKAA